MNPSSSSLKIPMSLMMCLDFTWQPRGALYFLGGGLIFGGLWLGGGCLPFLFGKVPLGLMACSPFFYSCPSIFFAPVSVVVFPVCSRGGGILTNQQSQQHPHSPPSPFFSFFSAPVFKRLSEEFPNIAFIKVLFCFDIISRLSGGIGKKNIAQSNSKSLSVGHQIAMAPSALGLVNQHWPTLRESTKPSCWNSNFGEPSQESWHGDRNISRIFFVIFEPIKNAKTTWMWKKKLSFSFAASKNISYFPYFNVCFDWLKTVEHTRVFWHPWF